MPYDLITRGRSTCVVKQGTGDPVPGGCHGSAKEARAHMEALYANEPQAAAFPLHPPASWFDKPSWLEAGTKLQVVTDGPEAGRVAGYVAPWNQCLLDGSNECWTVPSSPSAYLAAHQGETLTQDGLLIRTANIGGGVNHARYAADFRGAVDHNSNTASQLMRVVYGEDDYGIWCAGALWPDVSERDIAMVRASALSGDWRFRPEYGAYDFAGSILVNNPGLPLIRRFGYEQRKAASIDWLYDPDMLLPPVYVGGLGGTGEFEPALGAYNEEDHPRASDGKWTDGGSDAAPSGSPSPPAKGPGSKAEPIKVKSAKDAAHLIKEGKYVEMPSNQVSTLLDRLAKIAKDAKDKGEEAPLYDLCKVSVSDTNLFCEESMGIARSAMPQLSGMPVPGSPADAMDKNAKGEVNIGQAFRDHLAQEGYKVTDADVPAAYLRATQNELNGAKVAGMMTKIEAGTLPEARIFVSSDNYIIDGHHHWAANVGIDYEDRKLGDVTMPVTRIDAPISVLLGDANKFAADMGIAPKAAGGATAVLARVADLHEAIHDLVLAGHMDDLEVLVAAYVEELAR